MDDHPSLLANESCTQQNTTPRRPVSVLFRVTAHYRRTILAIPSVPVSNATDVRTLRVSCHRVSRNNVTCSSLEAGSEVDRARRSLMFSDPVYVVRTLSSYTAGDFSWCLGCHSSGAAN